MDCYSHHHRAHTQKKRQQLRSQLKTAVAGFSCDLRDLPENIAVERTLVDADVGACSRSAAIQHFYMRADFPVCARRRLWKVNGLSAAIYAVLPVPTVHLMAEKQIRNSATELPDLPLWLVLATPIHHTYTPPPPLHPRNLNKTATGESPTAGSLTPSRNTADGSFFHLSPPLDGICLLRWSRVQTWSKHAGQEYFLGLHYLTSKYTLPV